MPPCLRGCGLQLGVMKSYSTSMTRTSNNSSSSTLSESSNSPIFICTRKPRTKRKRLNQKYNEAAALLSIAYPDIFSSENLISSLKFSSTDVHSSFFDESSELLLPLRAIDKSEFLLQQDLPAVQASGYGRPSFQTEPKPCQSPGEVEIQSNPMEFSSGDYQEELDAGSILDEEMEEGIIDAIMEGHTSAANPDAAVDEPYSIGIATAGFGWKIGSGFEFGRSMNVNNALRNVRGVKNRWDSSFLTVDMVEISPKLRKSALIDSSEKKKRRKKKNAEKSKEEPKHCSNEVSPPGTAKLELLLKLDYDGILRAWSGQGSPFSSEGTDSDEQGMDATARLAQIDLFPEAGGVREASVQRYKEKRQTRLYSKKIRYEVRKVNADQRPRMKVYIPLAIPSASLESQINASWFAGKARGKRWSTLVPEGRHHGQDTAGWLYDVLLARDGKHLHSRPIGQLLQENHYAVFEKDYT
ncbi:hypothetical protein SAY87_022961 [Trapa incisa]|uniref:CCT domain-containing protein n=1 Tax=Trapa incisa TaxID=236973 RepID=A0AAN7QA24_9MYRT|nr:hypothetical protein SAY87_022961 [Trapa incisa]